MQIQLLTPIESNLQVTQPDTVQPPNDKSSSGKNGSFNQHLSSITSGNELLDNKANNSDSSTLSTATIDVKNTPDSSLLQQAVQLDENPALASTSLLSPILDVR